MTMWLVSLIVATTWTLQTKDAIVVSKDGTPVWRTTKPADNDRYTAFLVDMDGDGNDDVIAYGSEEIDWSTTIYLNRGDTFIEGYTANVSHGTLFDFDHDGKPELLISTESADGLDCDLDSKSEAEAVKYAKTAAAGFAKTHYDYGSKESEGELQLHMREPIKVIAAKEGKLVDATKNYPDFLKWRAQTLRAAAKVQQAKGCTKHFNDLAAKAERQAPKG
jgi:hypothetical protein